MVDDRALDYRVGFWTPLNLIAHTLWRSAPTDAAFSVGGLIIGMIVHMMVSMMLGVVLAVIAERSSMSRPLLLTVGMAVALMVWLVMQFGIWRAIDPTAAQTFTPWVFAVGHLMFGAVTAGYLAAVVPAGAARHGAHS